jgi:DNA-binding MarR family transcriptional regulator
MTEPADPSEQALLSNTALAVFKLNGQFLTLADDLAQEAGLTAAWWQVLGAVLVEPLPVSGIAREMGITRQSVQRIADLLVAQGQAEYRENPAHRRAKLLAATEAGYDAVARIGPRHAVAAKELTGRLGRDELAETLRRLRALSAALDAAFPPSAPDTPR